MLRVVKVVSMGQRIVDHITVTQMSVLFITMFILISIRSTIVVLSSIMLTVMLTTPMSSIGIVIETKHPVGNAVYVRLPRHMGCSSE